MQRCSGCDVEKPWREFHRDATKATGHRVKCKLCIKEYGNKRYQEKRDDALAWRQDYYQRNREAVLEQARQYRAANRDKISQRLKERREVDPEAFRLAQTLWRYGLSRESYDRMLEAQGGACAICRAEGRLFVDHDHDCCPGKRSCGKCVRGLLCERCNFMLGHGQDSIEVLLAGVTYLRSRRQADVLSHQGR